MFFFFTTVMFYQVAVSNRKDVLIAWAAVQGTGFEGAQCRDCSDVGLMKVWDALCYFPSNRQF